MSTAAPFVQKKTQTQTKIQLEPVWEVVALNDPVNLMDYVTMIFQRVFGYKLEKARKHMLEVHQEGQSILWSGAREQAEHYVYALQSWQLTAVLRKSQL